MIVSLYTLSMHINNPSPMHIHVNAGVDAESAEAKAGRAFPKASLPEHLLHQVQLWRGSWYCSCTSARGACTPAKLCRLLTCFFCGHTLAQWYARP